MGRPWANSHGRQGAGGQRCSSLVRAQRPKRGAPVPTSPPSLQPICAICLNKRAFLAGQRAGRRLSAFVGARNTIGCDLKVTVAHLHSDRDRSYCAFCRAHGGFSTPKTRRILDICKKTHRYIAGGLFYLSTPKWAQKRPIGGGKGPGMRR